MVNKVLVTLDGLKVSIFNNSTMTVLYFSRNIIDLSTGSYSGYREHQDSNIFQVPRITFVP